MNDWWSSQEYYCKCQGSDPWVHVHYEEYPHSCARCGSQCREYRPYIPEEAGIKILLGPEILPNDAIDILLGKESSRK